MTDKPPREPTFLGAPPPGPAPTPKAISEPAAVVRTALDAIHDAVPGGPGARPIVPELLGPVAGFRRDRLRALASQGLDPAPPSSGRWIDHDVDGVVVSVPATWARTAIGSGAAWTAPPHATIFARLLTFAASAPPLDRCVDAIAASPPAYEVAWRAPLAHPRARGSSWPAALLVRHDPTVPEWPQTWHLLAAWRVDLIMTCGLAIKGQPPAALLAGLAELWRRLR
jgi:hypothetical protein